MASRLKTLENMLTNNTVLDEWFTPAKNALKKIRYSDKIFTTLSMSTFILQNCVRQLNNCATLRDHLQHLFHLDDEATVIPLARSTYSDALSSNTRLEIVSKAAEHLVLSATKVLPDRLSGIEGLGGRSIHGMDGT
jgi:hypothetical protein